MSDPSTAAPRPPSRSKGRRALRGIGIAILCVAVLASVTLSAAIIYRRVVAERLIARGLALLEIELGAITVEVFEPTRFAASDLQILNPVDLSIEQLEAHYSWSSLGAQRLESVDARGIQLRMELPGEVATRQPSPGEPAPIAETAPESAEWEPLLATLLAFPELPARRIDLTDLKIELAATEGTYRINGELHATQSDNLLEARTRVAVLAPIELAAGFKISRSIDLEVELEAERDAIRVAVSPATVRIQIQGDEPVDIEAETPAIDLRLVAVGAAPPQIEIESAGGRVSVPAYDIEASGFALRTAFAASGLPRHFDLRVASVRDLRRPARIPPASLTASLELGRDRHHFQLALRDLGERIELGVHGVHDASTDRGSAEFHLQPILFAEDGLQPAVLLRQLAGLISNVSGNVEALGSVTWAGLTREGTPLELRTGVDLALRDVSLTTPLLSLVAINSVIHVDGPWPPSTPPEQLLQIGLIDIGFAVTDSTISFQLHEDLTLNLEKAVLHFADGTLRAAGLLDLAAPEQSLAFEVSGVELEALFALVDLEGLAGSGTLSGTIPLVRTGDAIEVRGGVLSNRGANGKRTTGWIRYRPGAGVAAAASQSEFRTALEALENFHYEELVLLLSGSPNGSLELSLHLAGSNPDFHDGYPVNFNLNLDAPLESLLKGAAYTQGVVEKIEQDFSAFRSRAANFPDAAASTPVADPVAPGRVDR